MMNQIVNQIKTSQLDPKKIEEGLEASYLSLDAKLLEMAKEEQSGCTAVTVFISPEHYSVANCGDSRAVLCRGGHALPLSVDQKPYMPDERDRIQKAGGYVI